MLVAAYIHGPGEEVSVRTVCRSLQRGEAVVSGGRAPPRRSRNRISGGGSRRSWLPSHRRRRYTGCCAPGRVSGPVQPLAVRLRRCGGGARAARLHLLQQLRPAAPRSACITASGVGVLGGRRCARIAAAGSRGAGSLVNQSGLRSHRYSSNRTLAPALEPDRVLGCHRRRRQRTRPRRLLQGRVGGVREVSPRMPAGRSIPSAASAGRGSACVFDLRGRAAHRAGLLCKVIASRIMFRRAPRRLAQMGPDFAATGPIAPRGLRGPMRVGRCALGPDQTMIGPSARDVVIAGGYQNRLPSSTGKTMSDSAPPLQTQSRPEPLTPDMIQFRNELAAAYARHPALDTLPIGQARTICEAVRRPWADGGPVMHGQPRPAARPCGNDAAAPGPPAETCDGWRSCLRAWRRLGRCSRSTRMTG